ERMNTDDDVRAPAFEESSDVTDAALMKKLARLGTNTIQDPVVILYPVLAVAQQPVVKTDQLVGEMMRLLNRAHHANRIRLAVEKLLHAGDYSGGGGA